MSPANGADLRFYSTNRSSELNYEIESWNTNGVSRVWVQVDLLASNTFMYAMWGNTNWSVVPGYTSNGAAWNADYAAVWHLNETVTNEVATTNAFRDSTRNHKNGDYAGSSNIEGPVGRAQYFDGSNDYINVQRIIVSAQNLTIAAWMKIDGTENWAAVINNNDWLAGCVHYQFPADQTSLDYDLGGSWHADLDSFSFNTGQWYHVVAAYDRSAGGSDGTLYFYVDGILKQSVGGLATTQNPSPTPGHIGSWGLDRFFKGAMDEFRILYSAPSSNWFWAAWLTAASNQQFTSYGEVQHETPLVHYVSPDGGAVWPYTNWGDAATNIQSAVDASSAGDIVLVTNGTYLLHSQIAVDKDLTIRSVNGPEDTIIDGNNTNRCFNLYGYITRISGFTIKNGNAGSQYGGGVFCSNSNPIIANCTISGNSAEYGGGTYQGKLYNCSISGNSANSGGATAHSTVNNCSISYNTAEYGGGTLGGTINNSIIYYNSAPNQPNRHSGTYTYCCTTPDATNGIANISDEPLLLSFSHIATTSPCIGAGNNADSSGVDIDGETWKDPPSIGCDEVYVNAISGSLSVAISSDSLFTYIGAPITFSSVINGKAAMSTWTFDDGYAEFNKIQTAHAWSAVGEYTVKLLAVNSTYPSGISDSISIKVITNYHFVNIHNSTPVPPYSTWATAATNIQDAIDIAWNGCIIYVTNGTYLLDSQIDVDKSLTIKSVNGPEDTIIDGNNSVRCFFLHDHTIEVDGFTIANGNAETGFYYGGGVISYSFSSVITNCIITGNSAYYAGGIAGGSVCNSIITGNSAVLGGGAVESSIHGSEISGNLAYIGGAAYACSIYNSSINGNEATVGGGTAACSIYNSSIFNNRASEAGGCENDYIYNCTIIENTALKGGGTYNSEVNNSIVYYNSAPEYPNRKEGVYSYCCTTPDATNGIANISDDPMLLSISHIATNSPCIGAGDYQKSSGVDIDGEIWKDPPSIGCDEVYANAISGHLSVAICADSIYTYVNTPLQFYADIEGKLSKNIWTFDDGTAETDTFQVARSWGTTGSFSVILTAFNETYPAGVSDSITVHVGPATHFVNGNNPTPVPPYVTWATAANTIQDAVDTANNGGTIIVANGVYRLNSPVAVRKSIVIQSVNGPETTIVNGNKSVSCFNLYNYNTTLSGFTITDGNNMFYFGAGGVICDDTTPVITNCIIRGNSASYYGGGTVFGTFNNCHITENSAEMYGGGTFYSTVNNCLISENSANTAGGAYGGTIQNCTIVDNVASNCGGAYECTINNSIIWSNTAYVVSNNFEECDIQYSCSFPLPTGAGNISVDPQFISSIDNNFRLKPTSPCRNAGTNAFAPLPYDLANAPRIIDGTVDMGCYEYAYPPYIAITQYPAQIEYSQTAAYISGTNVLVDGKLGWTNDKDPGTTNYFPQGFSITVSNLVVGENTISIFGTNRYFQTAENTVCVERRSPIEIAADALILPSANSILYEYDLTNISWHVDGITDEIDGTNVTIAQISLLLFESTNAVAVVTNDIANVLGEIPWTVPSVDSLLDSANMPYESQAAYSYYVLQFDVVDSLSYTNSRIFWDNTFLIVPEGGMIFGVLCAAFLIVRNTYQKKRPGTG